MKCSTRILVVLLSVVALSGGAQGPGQVPTFDLTLRPVREGGPEVTAIEVRTELTRTPSGETGSFSVRAPVVYASVTGIADRIQDLEVSDPTGTVPLTVHDDPVDPGGFPFYRHWRAERAVTDPVVVTYLSFPQSTPPVVGPQFAFRAHGGGISTAGSGFLALPEDLGGAAIRLHWDLSDLPAGSISASTFGEGDLELNDSPEVLTQGYFMVGPLGRYASGAVPGFAAYWLGQPPFDPSKEMEWAANSFKYQREFFGDKSGAPYRVFIRALPGTTRGGGGTALQNSFMLATQTGDGDPSVEGPRETIAHEMGHMFVGDVAENSSGPWFAEGLTVFYTRLLLLRSGLEPVSAYERSVNSTARAYFASPYRNASADSLNRLGFSVGVGAGSAQNVPYTRGSLYFATVDYKIREASGGKRKLDDVLLPLFERRREGNPFDVATLVADLQEEYGPSARTDFESVIVRGRTIIPPSGAFGPCFERRPTKLEGGDNEVDGYEWVRVSTMPDEACRTW